jgi:hypothetical protein
LGLLTPPATVFGYKAIGQSLLQDWAGGRAPVPYFFAR